LGSSRKKQQPYSQESAGVGATEVFDAESVTAEPLSYWGRSLIFVQPLIINNDRATKENKDSNFFMKLLLLIMIIFFQLYISRF
jgi:hypothetical protein